MCRILSNMPSSVPSISVYSFYIVKICYYEIFSCSCKCQYPGDALDKCPQNTPFVTEFFINIYIAAVLMCLRFIHWARFNIKMTSYQYKNPSWKWRSKDLISIITFLAPRRQHLYFITACWLYLQAYTSLTTPSSRYEYVITLTSNSEMNEYRLLTVIYVIYCQCPNLS